MAAKRRLAEQRQDGARRTRLKLKDRARREVQSEAGDLVCAVLTRAFDAMHTFEDYAAERGITVPQALVATIAHGLASTDCCGPSTASTERRRVVTS